MTTESCKKTDDYLDDEILTFETKQFITYCQASSDVLDAIGCLLDADRKFLEAAEVLGEDRTYHDIQAKMKLLRDSMWLIVKECEEMESRWDKIEEVA